MTETVIVNKIFSFDMAHALYQHNGLCKNIHGHTYTLTIGISGKIMKSAGNSQDGMVIDFSIIKQIVKDTILSKFDHALVLNNLAQEHRLLAKKLQNKKERVILLNVQPTCENLLLHFKNILLVEFQKHEVQLHKVILQETPTSSAEWHYNTTAAH